MHKDHFPYNITQFKAPISIRYDSPSPSLYSYYSALLKTTVLYLCNGMEIGRAF